MKLLKLTATFGKLDHETLELSDGLNILTRPNESGKSTWAVFLLAMFYGIDTRERASVGVLPAKTKFKPWNGAPMEGVIELEHEGRYITIERTSRGRTPMGEFRAYDTRSGQPIPELTAETCGTLLLGAERSVFERSAFLQQNAMAVTSDAALERKLAALVTTGDEDVSFSDTQKRLRELKNRCQHNKTGLLPAARAELADISARLAQIDALHRNDRALRAQHEALTAQEQTLQQVVAGFAAQTLAAQQARFAELETDAARAQQTLAAQQAVTDRLPDEAALQTLARALQTPDAPEPPLPQPPEPPQSARFPGLSAQQAQRQAQQDVQDYDRLQAAPAPGFPPVFQCIAALLALGGALYAFLNGAAAYGIGLLALAILSGGAALVLHRKTLRAARSTEAARKILQKYDVQARDDILAQLAQYQQQWALYDQQCAACQAQRTAQEEARRIRAEQQAHLLGQASMLGVPVTTREDALHAVQHALEQYAHLRTCRSAAETALHACQAARALLPPQPPQPFDPALLEGYTSAQAQAQLRQITQQLAAVQSELDLGRGRIAALGERAALCAQQEQLHARIATLETEFAALELAECALESANATLQTRFSPQLCKLAGQLLSRLTGARYDAVLLDTKLHAAARESGGSAAREILSLSSGTADQIYLAVRLAICQLSLNADTPLVLDDALIRFDDARLARALHLLQEQAQTRQILLFTCQNREAMCLQETDDTQP